MIIQEVTARFYKELAANPDTVAEIPKALNSKVEL